MEVVLNVTKGVTFEKNSYFKLPNSRGQPRVAIILFGKNSLTKNVICLSTCNKCNLQYVGSTSTEFKVRFRNHKSGMLNNRRTCELAMHYNSSEHDIWQIIFIVIEQISSFGNPLHLGQLLLTREAYWTSQLLTLNPHGLNKRRESRSKHLINYYS